MNYILGNDERQIKVESIDEYVDENSEVRVIDKIVHLMDIQGFGIDIGKNKDAGRPKFDPKDLLKLFIYGCFNGIGSSRNLEKQCRINSEVIWLLQGLQPKYRVIADFRKDNIDAYEKMFSSFVGYSMKLGLCGK